MRKRLKFLLDKYFPKKFRIMVYDDFATDLTAEDSIICRTRVYTAKYTNHRFIPKWYVLDAITVKSDCRSMVVSLMQSCKEFCFYQEKRENDSSKKLSDIKPTSYYDQQYLEWLKDEVRDKIDVAPFKRKRYRGIFR